MRKKYLYKGVKSKDYCNIKAFGLLLSRRILAQGDSSISSLLQSKLHKNKKMIRGLILHNN
jgi:hypothetical protein